MSHGNGNEKYCALCSILHKVFNAEYKSCLMSVVIMIVAFCVQSCSGRVKTWPAVQNLFTDP